MPSLDFEIFSRFHNLSRSLVLSRLKIRWAACAQCFLRPALFVEY